MKKFTRALPLLALPVLFAMAGGRSGEEPGEEDYSFEEGVKFLSEASRSWRAEHECVTCHTNGWGLAAQPVIAPGSKEVAAGRSFAQGYLMSRPVVASAIVDIIEAGGVDMAALGVSPELLTIGE